MTTKIKILIYTDNKDFSSDGAGLSVSTLLRLLRNKQSRFVEYDPVVVNRYQGCIDGELPVPPAPIKITQELLEGVDEVWFFGWFQKDTASPKFNEYFGTNQNELGLDDEVEVLRQRMNGEGIGVLVSGDHSAFFNSKNDPIDDFLCLGRALGHRVPRAGELRKWRGEPTNKTGSTFNTLAAVRETGQMESEDDHAPQELALFNSPAPGSPPQPHRLFLGRNEAGKDRTINIFPDHQHEGEILIPDPLGEDWPPDSKPIIVALGFDRQVNAATPVLAVYDGDPHKVGRIVADSSWHHYVNVNLEGFLEGGGEGSKLGLLAQFYRNLALYLAPLSKRQKISREMIEWARTHPAVVEERGNDPIRLGQVAARRLSEVATRCEIAEMLHVESLDEPGRGKDLLDFPALDSGLSHLPSQELVLGTIIDGYFDEAVARHRAAATDASLTDDDGPRHNDDKIIAAGIKEAFRAHNARLEELSSGAKDFFSRSDEAGGIREADMAHEECRGRWERSTFQRRGQPDEPDGEIEIRLLPDGTLEGTHRDTGAPLENLTCDGTNISFSRVDTVRKKEVFYSGRIVEVPGRFIIEGGSFHRNDTPAVADDAREGKRGKPAGLPPPPDDTGDWQAQKPT